MILSAVFLLPFAVATPELRFDASALADEIPAHILTAYLAAAEAHDLDWALIAAVGKLECDHGRTPLSGCNPIGTINHAGARGPMQFLGSTWTGDPADRYRVDVAGTPDGGWGVDADGDGIADPWSIWDAAHAAAGFLVHLGGREDPHTAARSYNAGPNNADPLAGVAYATEAVALVAHYHALAGPGGPGIAHGDVNDGWSLPFERSGLLNAANGRDPEWLLVKPHHSGRVGADIPLVVGTPLYAMTDGEIVQAGFAGNCGLTVEIHHRDEATTATYCHLSQLTVASGDTVVAGEQVGRSGGKPGHYGAGNSTGPHLHLHLDRADGRRCPQAILLGLWRGWPVPDPINLRRSGCTYSGVAPAEQRPAPIPPDLPIPQVVGSTVSIAQDGRPARLPE